MPNRTAPQFPPLLDHWKVFTQMEQTQMFRPSIEQMYFVQQFLQGADGK
jgi:hypothetical protein